MRTSIIILALLTLLSVCSAGQNVWVAKKPGEKYILENTTTLSDLPKLDIDSGLDKYGGIPCGVKSPSGFFQVQKIDNRWWIIDPEGGKMVHRGIATVAVVNSPEGKAEIKNKFQNKEGWANATVDLLVENGFNGTGAWSDDKALKKSGPRLSYTKTLALMGGYAKTYGVRIGWDSFSPAEQCQFIFDPSFATYCGNECKKIQENSNDQWLLGYYTDNEIPWRTNLLKNLLKLKTECYGHKGAEDWLKKHGLSTNNISEKSQLAFLEYASDKYFNITTTAIRANDPNHMILGARFNPPACMIPEVLSSAGRYCDVISINYYQCWTPDNNIMNMWTKYSKKPFLISEWYAKAEDSGMANTGGAGWLVRTQKDRGLFYQNFTIGLLQNPGCIGWHWFRYADEDPEAVQVNLNNQDSNKGIVNNRYVPYQILLAAMREVNSCTYGIIKYFDKK